jgi:hypothetical protein
MSGKQARRCILTVTITLVSKWCHSAAANSLDLVHEASQTELREIEHIDTDRRVEMGPHGSGTSRLEGQLSLCDFRRCHISDDLMGGWQVRAKSR